MGFNFRKSIKLGKLFKLNVSKSGASVSFGGKGFRQSIGTSGNARTTFSLPGTGLSYSKTINAKKLLKMGSDRKIFQQSNTGLSPEIEVQNHLADIALITTLHLEEDYPRGVDWNNVLKEEEPFKKGEDGPFTKEAKEVLAANKPGFFKKLFGGGTELKELEKEVELAKKKDEELYASWKNNKVLAEKILHEDKDAYIEALEELKLSEELGSYLRKVDFSYADSDSLNADIVLSIDDFIPEEYQTLTPTGKLSVKSYTKTDYYEIANQFVAGIVLRTARNLFNLLPIDDVFINVHEMEKSKYSGQEIEELILSIFIDRKTLDKMNMENINSFDALKNFRHEVNFVKTKGFNKIDKLEM